MGTTVGSVTVTVDVSGDTEAMLTEKLLNVKSALKAMADATVQRAQMLRAGGKGNAVPYKTGALQSTGIVEPRGEFEYVAQFGAGLTYGRYQEFGPDGYKYTGTKTEWDYTTPGTGPHYLRDAGDSVAKEGIKNYL